MKRFLTTICAIAVLGMAWAGAQSSPDRRHVTPVKPSTNTVLRPAKGTKEEVIKRYLVGDTAEALAEIRRDSLKRVYPHYPAVTEVILGANVGDLALMAFGQKYGSFGVSGTLNMWNRLQPEVELGVGFASNTPDDLNFTYKGKPSPYFKIGVNYNLLFKSTPKYQGFVGARLGYSTFSYDVKNVTVEDGYWGTTSTFDLTGEKSHALWFEVLAGLRVQLWKQLSLGWQARYHHLMSCKKNATSEPWFVPGYGSRDKSLTVTISVYYTLPMNLGKWPQTAPDPKKK